MKRIAGEFGTVWHYDPKNIKVYDANMVPLFLRHTPTQFACATRTHPRGKLFEDYLGSCRALNKTDKYVPFNNRLTDLTIQLGVKCNLKCIYCSQNACLPELSKVDVDSFLKRLKNSNINWDHLMVIQFWGGEPLVYWKHLKKIVEFIRSEIPQFKGSFHTTTNGSLLDMPKAEFFVRHGVKVQVSHDGVNHKQQRTKDDWLENKDTVKAVLYLLKDNQMGDVNMTCSPLFNPDIFESLELFEKVIPGVQICNRAPLRCDSSNDYLMSDWTDESVRIARDSYYRLITLKPGERFYDVTWSTRSRLLWLCMNLIHGMHPQSIAFNCPSLQRYEMCFNLSGNFIPCHGSTESMGFGFGSIDDVEACYATGFTSMANPKMCDGCLYSFICQGPCGMFEQKDAESHCNSTQWAWAAWFDAVWKTIFGEKPVVIEEVEDVCFD